MPKPIRIPLFPLEVVLLPGTPLPLHIFEPRYKLMIQRCMDEHIEFGMVLASGNAMAATGCTAEIVRKLKDYPDGRMDILTEGRSVFHLTHLIDEKAYYEGDVVYETDADDPLDPAQEAKLIELFEQCHAMLFGQPWAGPNPPDEPQPSPQGEPQTSPGVHRPRVYQLSYEIAALAPMELPQKQALLEAGSEAKRRGIMLEWLGRLLPKIIERQRGRKRAGGNGHALN